MKTKMEHPLFSEEQLNNMSRESLMELIEIQNVHTHKLEKQMQSLENEVRVKMELVKELEFLNALLNDKLTLAQRQRFGASSEKIKEGYEQLSLYSITETAKLNGLRPYSYQTYLLQTMKNHQADTNYDFIDTLLPWSKELLEECKSSSSFKRQ